MGGSQPLLRYTPIQALAELGPAGGTSGARTLACDDGHDYVVKTPRWSQAAGVGSFLAPNEMICAQLAGAVGVPILPWTLVRTPSGDIGFASRKMANVELTPLSAEFAERLTRPGSLGAIGLFDLWVCNTDRHNGNVLIRRGPRNSYSAYAIDHGSTLLRHGIPMQDLEAAVARRPLEAFFLSPEVRSGMSNSAERRSTLEVIESLNEQFVRTVAAGVPDDWLSDQEREFVAGFLYRRARDLRSLLRNAGQSVPGLGGLLI